MTIWRRRAEAFLVLAWLATGTPAFAFDVPPATIPPGTIASVIESRLSTIAKMTAKKSAPDVDDAQAANAFYAGRGYAPLWVTGAGLNESGQRALNEIEHADEWGLKSDDFVRPAPLTADATLDALADAEVTLTRAVLKYARNARGGRIPDPGSLLSGFIDRKPQLLAPQSVLEHIATAPAADAYLRGLNPQQPGFERLRQAYLKERSERGSRAATMVPAGPTILPGQSHPQIAILRKRLGAAVPVTAPEIPSPAEYYDPQLVSAVKAFQETAALSRPDGKLGPKTRAALNAEGGNHIPALLANMEQWRWMPEKLGETYVTVNIPQYEVRLVQGGRVVHQERVVTGKTETATPIFSADMKTVVFQPKWGVPDSIKINELLPRLQQGRGLRSGLRMALNGRDVDPGRVDWSRADITRYQIYQPSGDDNALGIVKFLFPNKHSVYLHDTPTKNLFNSASRAYSHGCVRVRNPVHLAELVLGADKGWDSSRIKELAEDGPEDNAIKLDATIPVHITYFTVAVDDAGKVVTFPDIYGHERRIRLALDGKFDQIAKLNPLPLGSTRPADFASVDGEVVVQNRRTAEAARFAPPAGLGFSPPEPTAPTSKSRYRGNTTNDIIMRQLGGGF
jgi:L,D-transpeptidase YcbB